MCPLARKVPWLPCNKVNLLNGHPDFGDFLCGFWVHFTEKWKTQVQGAPRRNQMKLCIFNKITHVCSKSHMYESLHVPAIVELDMFACGMA